MRVAGSNRGDPQLRLRSKKQRWQRFGPEAPGRTRKTEVELPQTGSGHSRAAGGLNASLVDGVWYEPGIVPDVLGSGRAEP